MFSSVFYDFTEYISADAFEHLCLFAIETQLHEAVSISPHRDTFGMKLQILCQPLIAHILCHIQACFRLLSHIIDSSIAYIVFSHDISPALNQELHDLVVAVHCSYVNRCVRVSVGNVHIGPSRNQEFHYLKAPLFARQAKCRITMLTMVSVLK